MRKLIIFMFGIILLSSLATTLIPTQDESINSYNLTESGGIIYNNIEGYYDGDGINDYLYTVAPNILLNNFTVMFAWKDTGNDSVDIPINSNGFFGLKNSTTSLFKVYISRNATNYGGRVNFEIRNITNSYQYPNSGTSTWKNQTEFITHTWVVTSIIGLTTLDLYVNGIHNMSTSFPSQIIQANTTRLEIFQSNSAYLNGSIDNFTMYDNALNATGVLQLYQGTYDGAGKLVKYTFSNTTCTTPTAGMQITTNTTFCVGTYSITSSILINHSSNIVLDCNGSRLIGPSTNYSYGITAKGHNLIIKNCYMENFSVGIGVTNYDSSPTTYYENFTAYNNTFIGIGGLGGIFIDGYLNYNISNNRFSNFTDYGERTIGAHAVYASCFNQAQCSISGDIYNNYVYNMSSCGIKFNGQGTIKNIRVYNNTIDSLRHTQTDDFGVVLADTSNISVYDNRFLGTTRRAEAGIILAVGANATRQADNNRIYNNIFDGLDQGVNIIASTKGNYFYNNTFSDLWYGEYYIKNTTSNTTFYETDEIRIMSAWNQRPVIMNFTGAKNFTINNYNFTMYNGQSQWYPYDDVMNATVVLASNVVTYSKIMNYLDYIVVGNFTAGDSCPYSGVSNYVVTHDCNITDNINVLGNNVYILCPNYFNIYANITNYTDAFQFGSCNVSSFGYGGFK